MSSRFPKVRLGRVAKIRSGDAISKTDMTDDGVPVFGANGQMGYAPQANFPQGALCVGRVGSCGAVNHHKRSVFVSDNALVLQPREGASASFLEYVLRCTDFAPMVNQGAMPLLTGGDLAELRVPCPPKHVQNAIANYLDAKTAAIDALIAKKELLIEELRKYQEAVISEAVAGRSILHSSSNQAGPQHPWFGTLPLGFRVGPLKRAFSDISSGGTPETSDPANWADEGGTAWVAISDMSSTPVVASTAKQVSDAGRRSKRLREFPVGTLLYSMYASVGNAAQLQIPATINQAILALTPKSDIDARYAFWQLTAMRAYASAEARTGTQDNLNADLVKNFPFVFPPLLEQSSIAAYLDTKVSAIQRMLNGVNSAIKELRAYRAALISEAVTGKISV